MHTAWSNWDTDDGSEFRLLCEWNALLSLLFLLHSMPACRWQVGWSIECIYREQGFRNIDDWRLASLSMVCAYQATYATKTAFDSSGQS